MKSRSVNRIILILLVFLCCFPSCLFAVVKDAYHDNQTGVSSTVQGNGNPMKALHVEDELLVKFKKGVAPEQKNKAHIRHNTKKIKDFKRLRIHQVRIPKGQSIKEVLAAYRNDPAVEYVEPNVYVEADLIPNDPHFAAQRGLHDPYAASGSNDIDAPQAWDLVTGHRGVVVAVLDTGIDYLHEDLAANVWTNTLELNGIQGVDDDGNGYIDDIFGIDTYNEDSDPFDDRYHGTHVAGTIGAIGNNGIGVVGVNWEVSILACKFLGSNGSGPVSGAIECLEYIRDLKDRGHNIVATNNSWGWVGSRSQALEDAIADQQDILFVASAGNDGFNNDQKTRYPSNYKLSNNITVAATARNNDHTDFSNYGSFSVHVAAPGEWVYSTLTHNRYASLSGTSMAAPHVSGLVALLKAQDDSRSWQQIKNLILSGGDDNDSLLNYSLSGKKINAYGSMSCVDKGIFTPYDIPDTRIAATAYPISALSINCDRAIGPVSVTASTGEVIQLRDDGVMPDQAADDGIFTAAWSSLNSEAGVVSFLYSSPLGQQWAASKPIAIDDNVEIAVPAKLVGARVVSMGTGVYFSQQFHATGGVSPYQWSIIDGDLPDGLVLDEATGLIHGTPHAPGLYEFSVEVAGISGMIDKAKWGYLVNEGIRDGWPVILEERVGVGALPLSASPTFADLDNDGNDELIVADKNTLYLFDQTGLRAKRVFPAFVTTPAVADLDQDGVKEIVVGVGAELSNGVADPVYVLDQDLAIMPGFPAGGYPTYNNISGLVTPPVIADLDNDGALEIVIVCSPNNMNDQNYRRNVMIVLDRSGNILPGWPVSLGVFSQQSSLPAVGDVNGDGKQDIVLASADGRISIIDAHGNQSRELVFHQAEVSPSGIVLADVNGDGEQNLIIKYRPLDGGPPLLDVLNYEGESLGGWPRIFQGSNTAMPIVGDLDGDSLPEIIVVSGNYWEELHVYRGDGTTLPGWPVIVPRAKWGLIGIDCLPVVEDINHDGRRDVVIPTVTVNNNGLLLAYALDGSVLDGFPKVTTPNSDIRTSPALGDMDGNGRFDIALKIENGSLFVWEEATVGPIDLSLGWPMFRRDATHTANYAVPEVYQPILIETPGGNEWLVANTIYEIGWNEASGHHLDLSYSLDGGTRWIPIASVEGRHRGEKNLYPWKVPNVAADIHTLRIRIQGYDSRDELTSVAETKEYLSIITTGKKVKFLAPVGGEEYISGETRQVMWSPVAGVAYHRISLSYNNGFSWQLIASPGPVAKFDWSVPVHGEVQNDCLLRIEAFAANGVLLDKHMTPRKFTILPSHVKVLSPNGGEVLTSNTKAMISWQPMLGASYYQLWYSSPTNNNGWMVIANVYGQTDYEWRVPPVIDEGHHYRIWIVAYDINGRSISEDYSDNRFSILPGDVVGVQLLSPNGGENLASGDLVEIVWSPATDAVKYVLALHLGNLSETHIIGEVSGETRYRWTVPYVMQTERQCKISVNAYSPGLITFDRSDGFFTITTN